MNKDDKIVEKALVKTAEIMVHEDLRKPMLDGIEYCHSVCKYKDYYFYIFIYTFINSIF